MFVMTGKYRLPGMDFQYNLVTLRYHEKDDHKPVPAQFLPLASLAQSARTLCDQGLELKKNGQCKEAIEKYKLALAADPGMTEALYERGWCQSELKDFAGPFPTAQGQRRLEWYSQSTFELGYAFQQLKQKIPPWLRTTGALAINPAYSLVLNNGAI